MLKAIRGKAMKRSMVIIGSVLFLVIGIVLPNGKSEAASFTAPAKAEIDKIYEMAKKEGEINFISSNSRQVVAKLFEAFSRKYPGIKLAHVEESPAGALPRLIAEDRAGSAHLDVLHTVASTIPTLEDRDMLAQYDWNRVFGISKELIRNRTLLWYRAAHPIIYHTKLVAPGDVPKSYEDLLNPKFKGRMGIEIAMSALGYLAIAMGEEKLKDFAQKLKAQKPLLIKGLSTLVDRLAAEEVAIAFGGHLYKVYWYQDKGAPLDWARVSPLVVSAHHLSVMKKAPHPNAARLWVAWLTTPEAQELFEKLEYHSRLGMGATGRQWKAIQESKVKVWEFPETREALDRQVALKKEFGKLFGAR